MFIDRGSIIDKKILNSYFYWWISNFNFKNSFLQWGSSFFSNVFTWYLGTLPHSTTCFEITNIRKRYEYLLCICVCFRQFYVICTSTGRITFKALCCITINAPCWMLIRNAIENVYDNWTNVVSLLFLRWIIIKVLSRKTEWKVFFSK